MRYRQTKVEPIRYEVTGMKREICPICGGSGLLPFVNKAGKTIPNSFLFCECKNYDHEFMPELAESDFDFACSSDSIACAR